MTTLRWNETPRQRWARRTRALLIGVACAIGIGATSRVVLVDLMQWRDAGHIARTAAGNQQLRVRDRVNAIVVMQRDMLSSIELLKQLAAEGGEIEQHAENVLKALDRARLPK